MFRIIVPCSMKLEGDVRVDAHGEVVVEHVEGKLLVSLGHLIDAEVMRNVCHAQSPSIEINLKNERIKNNHQLNQLHNLTVVAFAMSMSTFLRGLSRYFPPQLRDRERSLPVPRGMIPIAGRGLPKSMESITERIQPTVPSPPHAENHTKTISRNFIKLLVEFLPIILKFSVRRCS